MRDGVLLATEVRLPSPAHGSGPYAAVVLRTPYGRAVYAPLAEELSASGFAVVVQDVRGRHESEGDWYPYFNEGLDGYDSVEWAAVQPWCTGAVGMTGGSYGGWVQWAAARERPPHLTTIASYACCALWTGEWPWSNGVLFPGAIAWNYGFSGRDRDDTGAALLRMYDGGIAGPLKVIPNRVGVDWPPAIDWLRHPQPDEYWRPIELTPKDFAAIDIPVLHVTGWFDGCQRGAQFLYEGMLENSPGASSQYLISGPWDHAIDFRRSSVDGIEFGSRSQVDVAALRLRWFDGWLRHDGFEEAGQARVFATGSNDWLRLDRFPTPRAAVRSWYLGPRRLTAAPPAAVEPPETFASDPDQPLYALDPRRPFQSFPSLTRTALHDRPDAVLYVSEPLDAALTIAGRPTVVVWLSSDAPDADLFAHLCDRAPDGADVLVSHGMLRGRFREGMERDVAIPRGEVVRFEFALTPRAHEFCPGHRLVLALCGSSYPLWQPNSNSGGDLFEDGTIRVAVNRIHHDPAHASRIDLPVLAGEALAQARLQGAAA